MFTDIFQRCCLLLLAATAFAPANANAQLIQQPQDGVLLMKHGATLSGFVTPAGDRYIVLFGDTGEARVPTKDVVAVVQDLQSAYRYKQGQLDNTIGAHLELARWCLQQDLPARAADQVLVAEQRYGRRPQIESIHRRLVDLATPVKDVEVAARNKSAVEQVNFEKDQDLVQARSIDWYTSAVQPLLLNRCANGGCHNMRGTSEFVLFRPFLGQATTRRMTEQNLKATLAFVDRTDPQSSQLLKRASAAHGGSVAAAIPDREQQQLAVISQWLQSLTVESPKKRPAIISSPPNELLYQPKQSSRREMINSTSPKPLDTTPQRVAKQTGDPFDPAIFNLKYHESSP